MLNYKIMTYLRYIITLNNAYKITQGDVWDKLNKSYFLYFLAEINNIAKKHKKRLF